ncbi:Ataxin-10 [Dispira parvispora]|uniref:Ataxin-10 homolog n=1 Tax=Dispira parvispora TaxID=1520584 RepID=A0A9W8E5P9_9FUNG|nr:Ataxin-10 [Dispira parvispora]
MDELLRTNVSHLSTADFIEVCRRIRQIAANGPSQQRALAQSSLPLTLKQRILQLYHSQPTDTKAVRFGLQALSNIVTRNPTVQGQLVDILWEADPVGNPEMSLGGLISIADPPTRDTLVIFMLNTVHSNPEVFRRWLGLTSTPLLLRQVFEHTELYRGDTTSLVFEVAYSLVQQAIALGLLPLLHQSLQSSEREQLHESALAEMPIDPLTITLLKFIDAYLNKELFGENEPKTTTIAPPTDLSKAHSELLDTLALWLMRMNDALQVASGRTSQVLQPNETVMQLSRELLATYDKDISSPSAKMTDTFHIDTLVNFYTALVLLLQGLRSATQSKHFGQWMESSTIERLLENTLDMLRYLDGVLPRMSKIGPQPHQIVGIEQASQQFAFVKRDLVAIIGNVVHGNTSLQNKTRELGGIDILLNQCNIDDNNPFIKEYALLALRNLLTGNLENQRWVQALQPQGTTQHPVLTELGLKTELDTERGNTPRLRQL